MADRTMATIRQDWLSISMTLLAVSLLLFLSTWGPDIMLRALFAAVLAVTGIVMSMVIGRYARDVDIDSTEGKEMVIWSAVAFGTIVFLSSVVPRIPLDISTVPKEQQWAVGRMLGVLIAVSEEQFFRGFIANLFIWKAGPYLGVVLSGSFFAVYHFAVYGSSPASLLFVMLAGIILTYTSYRTRRVSVPMIAHVANNLLAGG